MAAPKGLYIAFRTALADVPTPSEGKFTLFVDDDTLQFCLMHDDGTVVVLESPNLSAIAALVTDADKLSYFTGDGTAALTDFPAAARTLLAAIDAAAQRAALGLGTAAPLDVDTDGTLAANSDAKIPTQKATRTAINAAVAGLSWKQAVRAATTGAGTLASSFENGDTIDGVTLATGDRVLIKNQATASENGIYVVNASGAPTRATDADAGAELVNASVYVSEGTVNADTQWTCTTNAPITPGTTGLAFAQLTAGSATTFDGLSDVVITSPANGQIAKYNASSGHWENFDLVLPHTVAISDESTAITTGSAKITFRAPFACKMTALPRASLSAASSAGNPAFDINKNGASIFSTTLTVDSGETTSTTAATPAVLSGGSTTFADDDEITIDIDTAGTGAKGAKITLFLIPT